MTGGRLTRNSNDYTIGYARARRDLGCRYTLGFYDHHPELDTRHRVEVNSRRPGVHLVYAARYSFPSRKERRARSIEAAFLVPQQFEGGGLRAHLFPVQTRDAKTWSAILAVEFPVELGAAAGPTTREFGMVLRRGTTLAHSFHRSITLDRPAEGARTPTRHVTFVEPVELPPGDYELTAVLSDPAGDRPFGAGVTLALPAIPKREAVLAGPILGRRRGDDVVVYGNGSQEDAKGDRVGDRSAFRPLLVDDVDRSEPLAALTHACVVRAKASDGPWAVSRQLATGDGAGAGSLSDVAFGARKGSRVQCERLFDTIPVANLKPGRYTFRAVLHTVDSELSPTTAEVPFAVKAGEAGK